MDGLDDASSRRKKLWTETSMEHVDEVPKEGGGDVKAGGANRSDIQSRV